MCVSGMCFLSFFSLGSFSCLVVLLYSNFFVFVLFHFMVLLLLRCQLWFLRRDRKGVDLHGMWGEEELAGVEGGNTIIRIYYI